MKVKLFLMRNMIFTALLVFTPFVSRASGIPVVDVANLTQSIQQVIADGTKITHMVSQINNQVQQINQMSQTLQTVGGGQFAAIASNLTSQVSQIQSALGTISDISYQVAQVQNDFRTVFPASGDWSTINLGAINTIRKKWDQELENVTVEAMKAQAVTDRVQGYNTSAQSMLAQSQAGAGEVRQMQAMNQMMGVLIQQLSDVSQLLAANGRLASMAIAEQTKARESGRAVRERMLINYNSRGAPVAVSSFPGLSY